MNMSESTQAYWPFAYSLIMRQAGENSGLSTCKLSSRTSAAADVAIAAQAATTDIVGGVPCGFGCSTKLRPLCRLAPDWCSLTSYVGASDAFRTSRSASCRRSTLETCGLRVEVPLLHEVRRAFSRCRVGIACLCEVARHLVQMRPYRVEPVIRNKLSISLEPLDQTEAGVRAPRDPDRDGMVQLEHGIAGTLQQDFVQSDDLWPIRCFETRRFIMHRRDGGLDLVWPRLPPLQRVRDKLHTLADVRSVPQGPILFGHGNQLAIWTGARIASRIREKHQRQKPHDLSAIRQQPVEHAAKSNCFGRQIGPIQVGAGGGGITLVENEVEDMQHHAEPVDKF